MEFSIAFSKPRGSLRIVPPGEVVDRRITGARVITNIDRALAEDPSKAARRHPRLIEAGG